MKTRFCDKCGVEKPITGYKLRNKYRGWYNRACLDCERLHQRNYKKSVATRISLNKVYWHIKQRLYNNKLYEYRNYGARGIGMDEGWKSSFGVFFEWAVSNGYKKGLVIDRINNDKGYFPNNCRWVTNKENQNNKRNNHYVVYKGKTFTLSTLAEYSNIKYSTFVTRITRSGWTIKKAVETPVRKVSEKKNSASRLLL